MKNGNVNLTKNGRKGIPKVLYIILGIIGIAIIGVGVYFIFSKDVITDEEKFVIGNGIYFKKEISSGLDESIKLEKANCYDKDKYFYSIFKGKDHNTIKFYQKEKDKLFLRGKYNCSSRECAFQSKTDDLFFINGIYPIEDRNNKGESFVFLYDIDKNIISDKYFIDDKDFSNAPYMHIVEDRYTVIHGGNSKVKDLLLDNNFKVLASYDHIGKIKMSIENFYNYSNKAISVINNGKYGSIFLDDGKLGIPCKYDDIVIGQNFNIGISKNKMHFISDKGVSLSKDYDYLEYINKDFALAINDGYGFIIDRDDKIVTEKLKLLFNDVCGYDCDYKINPFVSDVVKGENVKVCLAEKPYSYIQNLTKCYLFNLKTKKFSPINSSNDKDDFVLGNKVAIKDKIVNKNEISKLNNITFNNSYGSLKDGKIIKFYKREANDYFNVGSYRCKSDSCISDKMSINCSKGVFVVSDYDPVLNKNFMFLFDSKINKKSDNFFDHDFVDYIAVGDKYVTFNYLHNKDNVRDYLLDSSFNIIAEADRIGFRTNSAATFGYNDDVILAVDNNKMGLMSLKDGSYVVKPTWNFNEVGNIYNLEKDLYMVFSDNSYFEIDKNGNVVSEKYTFLDHLNNNYYLGVKDGNVYFLDNKYNIISDPLKTFYNDWGINDIVYHCPLEVISSTNDNIYFNVYTENGVDDKGNLKGDIYKYTFNIKSRKISKIK